MANWKSGRFLLTIGIIVIWNIWMVFRVDDTYHIEDCGAECNQFIKPVLVPSAKFSKSFYIITGASDNHFWPMINLLYSIRWYEPSIDIIVWNLGLSEYNLQQLGKMIRHVKYSHNTTKLLGTIEVRTFQYSKYPSYFNMSINSGEFAWKPVLVVETMEDYKGIALWLDAGCIVEYPLQQVLHRINSSGFWSPWSDSEVKWFTHPISKALLHCGKFDENVNCDGAIVGFVYGSLGYQKIAIPWRECALIRDCIAPFGSSRANHRQDQSALTCLAHTSGIPGACDPWQSSIIRKWADDEWQKYLTMWQTEYYKGDSSLWPK